MSLIKGIHHISIKTSSEEEYEKTVDFYTNVLGLVIVRTWEHGIMFGAGDSIVEVFKNGERLEQGAIRHIAFATDDVDACVEAVKKAGYEVFKGPQDICIPSEKPFPARMAFCYGPVGEQIEFFCEK